MSRRAVLEYTHRSRCALGEGAIWDVQNSRLLWIDIVRGKLFSYDPHSGGRNSEIALRQLLGTVVFTNQKDLSIIAAAKGVAVIKTKTGECVDFLGNPEASSFTLRFNDGKCDPQGRLWVGSMEMQYGEPFVKKETASLWCFEGSSSGKSLKVEKKLDGVTISNGLAWNSKGDEFYYIDTPKMTVDVFDFEGSTGSIKNRRTAIEFPGVGTKSFLGYPDGMAICDRDTLFIACWGGGSITRWDPESGQLMAQYQVPGASQVTSCAFGGPNLDQLYITTAAAGIEEKQLEEGNTEEYAGSLFKIDFSSDGVKGVPSHPYVL
eukprot:UC4_evm1s267